MLHKLLKIKNNNNLIIIKLHTLLINITLTMLFR